MICLIYLTATRLDILNYISVFSRLIHFASKMHLKAAKKVFRYVEGTCSFGLKYKKIENIKQDFCDSDWGDLIIDMRSTSGYYFALLFMKIEKTRNCRSIYNKSSICCCYHYC